MDQLEKILVLDFGSPDSVEIARKIREYNVYSEIKPYFITAEKVKQIMPKGIILAINPKDIDNAGEMDLGILKLGIPVLETNLADLNEKEDEIDLWHSK
ncbi:MAG TPA: hypothetical protein GX526_00815 [Thermoanaerobacterales bacterium]|nr:hypothetical protein [Thermoanaerobacterales bacterium]